MGYELKMLDDKSDPEIAKLLHDRNWHDGFIGDATYIVSLIGLGYLPRDARWELSQRVMERSHRCLNGR